MTVKEKLKQLFDEGLLTEEDLKEIGVVLDSEDSKEDDNPESDPEKFGTEGEPENTPAPKVEETTEPRTDDSSTTDNVPPTDETDTGIPDENEGAPQVQETSTPTTDPAVDYNARFEEVIKVNQALAARIEALEQAFQSVKIPIPTEQTNSDFGLNGAGEIQSQSANSDFMDNVVKSMGGFSR